MNRKIIGFGLSAALLSGCATIDSSNAFIRAQAESNPAGVKGLIRGDELRALNIADLVGSFVPDWQPYVPKPGGSLSERQAAEQRATDLAIAAFYSAGFSEEKAALYRNEIQDRIIAAANQRCQLWKNYFATASSTVGFWSGIVGAATGAASIAFSPEGTKDALTAVSTTSTSVGTQYEKSYLFSLTMPVVFQGVESRRQGIISSVTQRRTRAGAPVPIQTYSLSEAIADALEYHAACSVASGLQQAQERLAEGRPAEKSATSPGASHAVAATESSSDARRSASPANR